MKTPRSDTGDSGSSGDSGDSGNSGDTGGVTGSDNDDDDNDNDQSNEPVKTANVNFVLLSVALDGTESNMLGCAVAIESEDGYSDSQYNAGNYHDMLFEDLSYGTYNYTATSTRQTATNSKYDPEPITGEFTLDDTVDETLEITVRFQRIEE